MMRTIFCHLTRQTKACFIVLLLLCSIKGFSQPANDNCADASVINISSGGFGLGTFPSATFDLSSATIQAGETFAPAILVAGQNKKSIWYKFTLPTTRSVRVILEQPGSAITAGDAGFTVYKANDCLPGGAQISTLLTPLGVFGETYHPCVGAGTYYVQVSGKDAANGPVYVSVVLARTTALYDDQADAYEFGTLAAPNYFKHVDYEVGCHSIESAAETCTSLANYERYHKSTWHTFTTPASFDYIGVALSGIGSPAYFTSSIVNHTIGYNLYRGNGKTTDVNSLTLVDGCDSFSTAGYYANFKTYKCGELEPNTTYTIQLFFRDDFNHFIRLAVAFDGGTPTQAPQPVSTLVPPSNNLGVLPSTPAGVYSYGYDQLACNSYHSLHPCDPALPANGIYHGGLRYNLSTFFTFTVPVTSKLTLSVGNNTPPNRIFSPVMLIRLYAQDITTNCAALDTANLVAPPFLSNTSLNLDCLPPGTYTVQVSGRDTLIPYTSLNYSHLAYVNYGPSLLTDLGRKISVQIRLTRQKGDNEYNLGSTGAFDTINVVNGSMQPMVDGVTYQSKIDTFGCANTVLPWDTTCATGNAKAMYRQFLVPDSGVVTINGNSFWQKLYQGDASALATAQNAFSYPSRINGLTPYTDCYTSECGGQKVCVLPGTYTHVTFGSANQIGQTARPSYKYDDIRTTHDRPENAENIGTVSPGTTKTSTLDYFSCTDNAMTIAGVAPCTISNKPATKAIYREFYLDAPATLSISTYHSSPAACGTVYGGYIILFKGKISDGVAGLTPTGAPFQCVTAASTHNSCTAFEPGWYTVVSYGSGPTYDNPFRDIRQNGYGSYVGRTDQVTISAQAACPGPKYNRPFKAAIDTTTGQPFLIEWGPNGGHTEAYPKTDRTYTLYRENFNCTVDTPFLSHAMPNCAAGLIKVSYYVFRLTQESYVEINTRGFWGVVYAGDARTDSASFGTATQVHPCQYQDSYMQICKMQPGVYTLVFFGNASHNCRSVDPIIYIDKVGYSRFDHANNAYDFGLIPPDSVYYSGKPGDVNPLDPGRAPSNDFIYCTTGAQPTDPTDGVCRSPYNSQIYAPGVNVLMYNGTPNATAQSPNIPLRNLWYTFVVDKGGTVRIKVDNKTIGKGYNFGVAVYKSNVDGTLPFSDVVSNGLVDSTLAQGLTLVAYNPPTTSCYSRAKEISFYREPCTSVTERYYIVVHNPNSYPSDAVGIKPNSQVEVSVLMDSVNAIQPLFDHYSQAYDMGNLAPGTHNGAADNYSCATRDAADPIVSSPNCSKTLWYKFTTNVSGYVRYRILVNNTTSAYTYPDIQLFRQVIPGDSSAAGLSYITGNGWYDASISTYWQQNCISPGTYYLILPGCNRVSQYVYPIVQIVEQGGDFCSAPALAPLSGPGTNVATVTVDCHTIGTDYGEFNPTLTCPAGATTTQYKSSWFRIDITGADTLDVTTYITENTNATSSDIKYRLMNGDCNAMQERSCVQDALTQDTYKCLAPGSYWVQVFSPIVKNAQSVTGTISLNLSAVKHVDTCAPINNCLSNANFQKQFDCTKDNAVTFINYSTFGSAVSYEWDFGYNNEISSAVSPKFTYPALTTDQKYYITLTVRNNSCGGQSMYKDSIVIPARPVVNLGRDTSLCETKQLLLDATSFPGATYRWQNNSTNPTFLVTTLGTGTYHVTVTYNGCISRDTIKVNIDPIDPRVEHKYICNGDPIVLNAARSRSEFHQWSTGATTASISVSTPGIYWDDIYLNGCVTRDTFIVSGAVSPLGDDREVCLSTPVTLNATTTGATGYTWQNGSTSSSIAVSSPGLYWVDISFGTCSLRDSITISGLQAVQANLSAAVCEGQTYTTPSGHILSVGGIHQDTLRTTSGCDSVIHVIDLSVQTATVLNDNISLCPGQSYTLPWGPSVSAAGTYRDTLRSVLGCDSVRRSVNITVESATELVTDAVICEGDSYTLPWGQVVSTPDIYRDTLFSVAGCDSVRRIVNLAIQPVALEETAGLICDGQTYTLPWGAAATAPGIYRDTLKSVLGCDSVRRVVNLTVQTFTTEATSATICEGASYTLPWGQLVSNAGTYRDTLRTAHGCDSVRRVITVTVEAPASEEISPVICMGDSYTLPWGTIVSSPGAYRDTLRSVLGCDSLLRLVNLTVQTFTSESFHPVICEGASYTLPWGLSVSAPGIYRDTLRSVLGCDSVRREYILSIETASEQLFRPVICEGASYTLPWGAGVNAAGIYRDTLRSVLGCDSVRRVVELTVETPVLQETNPVICSGQSYTLPWGAVVSNAGVYRDTLRSVLGCDSIRRVVNLVIEPFTVEQLNPVICEGSGYTLPWGEVVSVPGIYRDTLRTVMGCDSVRREVNLSVQTFTEETFRPVICEGSTYTLPSGQIVSAPGVYRDTLRSVLGCDSVRREVTLTVQEPLTQNFDPVICYGSSYTLPWGVSVSTAGVYRDTLHYTTGCDSVRRVVNLTVEPFVVQHFNPVICEGSGYTLPWGTVVTTPGIYRDTLRSVLGCDSVRREVNLSVQTFSVETFQPVICEGSTYTLPSGLVVNTAGVYRDTLRSVLGCDSVRREVTLTVQQPLTETYNPVICTGDTYTTPWGDVISAAGVYRDTLRYTTGCDSVRRSVNLTVQSWTVENFDPVICAGDTYTTPWGAVVNATGIYRDTLHYTTGCDSVRRTVNLKVQDHTTQSGSVTMCPGESYTLPWGAVVNAAGIYRDTLRYTTGCDSVQRSVNVIVQQAVDQHSDITICQGGSYTLPWGAVVNTAGVYRDTLRYTTGCDSVKRTVNLTVRAAELLNTNATICSDETYTLPWGAVVNSAGTYKDTVRTIIGCDSLIRQVNITVNPVPVLRLSKSNDVDCMLGTARLEATGGARYLWSPAESLSSIAVYNPVASPTVSTWYKVMATSNQGCSVTDSIEVKVITGTIDNGYLVPNAFTPDGDGRNDCFGVQTWGAVTDFELSVFNRWGERVFYTRDPKQCWDGRYKGVEQSSNVFVYQIRAKGLCGQIYRKGTVTLIR